jgi:hypothetical protein
MWKDELRIERDGCKVSYVWKGARTTWNRRIFVPKEELCLCQEELCLCR